MSYKLRNAFVAERPVPDGIRRFDVDPPASCVAAVPVAEPFTESTFVEAVDSDDVDEWDCDVLEATFESPGVLVLEAGEAALQAAVFAGRDCAAAGLVAAGDLRQGVRVAAAVHPGEHRLVLETAGQPARPYTLGLRFYALCGTGEVDDHGDTLLCATPITPGERHRGALWNAFGDDEDVFTLLVRRQGTFVVELRGTSGLSLALLDENGQRLAEGDARLVRTLVPGRYFVRVTGDGGGEASYAVGLKRLGAAGPSS